MFLDRISKHAAHTPRKLECTDNEEQLPIPKFKIKLSLTDGNTIERINIFDPKSKEESATVVREGRAMKTRQSSVCKENTLKSRPSRASKPSNLNEDFLYKKYSDIVSPPTRKRPLSAKSENDSEYENDRQRAVYYSNKSKGAISKNTRAKTPSKSVKAKPAESDESENEENAECVSETSIRPRTRNSTRHGNSILSTPKRTPAKRTLKTPSKIPLKTPSKIFSNTFAESPSKALSALNLGSPVKRSWSTPEKVSVNTPTKALSRLTIKNNLTPSMHRRTANIVKPNTPLQDARARLHVGIVPKSLPCREKEFNDIYTFLQGKLTDRTGG